MPAFAATVYQNQYLPPGGTKVHAIITVDASGRPASPRTLAGGFADAPGAGVPEHAEVLLLDCSGSMADPPDKASQVLRAACAAIDSLPDGVWFAVVRGTGAASMMYPSLPALVPASVRSRAEAKAALGTVSIRGGTAIGRWLKRARELFSLRPDAIGHATLLTDGQNGEFRHDFEAAVDACVGLFQCDCRGVGTDWRVDELRYVATKLLGTVDAVPEPAELTSDLACLVDAAISRSAGRLDIRIWTPRGARVQFFREVTPTLRELQGRTRHDRQGTPGVPSGHAPSGHAPSGHAPSAHERCGAPGGSPATFAIHGGAERSTGADIAKIEKIESIEKVTEKPHGRVFVPPTAAGAPGSPSGNGHGMGTQTVDYQTGAWGAESRDYHLHIDVPARDVGTEVLAARIELVVEEQVVSTALVKAVWTDDPRKSGRVDTAVAHYAGQAELMRTLQRGLDARKAGDRATATLMLGRGVQLARASGNEATYRLLQKVVDIDDSTTGTVRLKKNVEKIDEMVLDTRSTTTVRVNR